MKRLFVTSDQHGSTSIEFALTAPLFILIVAGVVGTGFLMWTQAALQRSVEAAARCGAVDRYACGTVQAIQQYAAAKSTLGTPYSSYFVSERPCGIEVSVHYSLGQLPEFAGAVSLGVRASHCYPK